MGCRRQTTQSSLFGCRVRWRPLGLTCCATSPDLCPVAPSADAEPSFCACDSALGLGLRCGFPFSSDTKTCVAEHRPQSQKYSSCLSGVASRNSLPSLKRWNRVVQDGLAHFASMTPAYYQSQPNSVPLVVRQQLQPSLFSVTNLTRPHLWGRVSNPDTAGLT